MQRRCVALSVIGLAVAAGRSAFDCSLASEPLFVEKHLSSDAPRPRNAEFHVWVSAWSTVDVDLLDSASRPVPLAVETVETPEGWRYLDRGQLVTARPFGDLAPGRYQLVYGSVFAPGKPTPLRTFVVTDERPTVPPPPPADVQARLVIERCPRGLGPACETEYGDCAFLRLDLQQPEGHWDPHLLYELAWWPETVTGADVSRRSLLPRLIARATGGTTRVVRVPTWALDGLRADDARLRLEITGIDHAGHRSDAVRASVEVGGFLRDHPPETVPRHRRFPGVDRRYREDLARFERVAPAEARVLFGRLEPVSSSPLGPEHDRAFERAVLARNDDVLMRAHLRGTGGRVHITMPVRIADGAAVPLISPVRFAEVIADLPLDAPTLTSLNLQFDAEGATADMETAEWSYLRATWRPTARDAVRKVWEEHLAAVELLTRQPLYQSLVEAHGLPTRRSVHGRSASAIFGRHSGDSVTISSRIRNGVLESLTLSCYPDGCRVGGLTPVVAAVERAMADDLDGLVIEIRPDGLLRIMAEPAGDGIKRFEGRLGTPDLRPISPPAP